MLCCFIRLTILSVPLHIPVYFSDIFFTSDHINLDIPYPKYLHQMLQQISTWIPNKSTSSQSSASLTSRGSEALEGMKMNLHWPKAPMRLRSNSLATYEGLSEISKNFILFLNILALIKIFKISHKNNNSPLSLFKPLQLTNPIIFQDYEKIFPPQKFQISEPIFKCFWHWLFVLRNIFPFFCQIQNKHRSTSHYPSRFFFQFDLLSIFTRSDSKVIQQSQNFVLHFKRINFFLLQMTHRVTANIKSHFNLFFSPYCPAISVFFHITWRPLEKKVTKSRITFSSSISHFCLSHTPCDISTMVFY